MVRYKLKHIVNHSLRRHESIVLTSFIANSLKNLMCAYHVRSGLYSIIPTLIYHIRSVVKPSSHDWVVNHIIHVTSKNSY